MIDWDKPIETNNGQPARLLCRDYKIKGNYTYMILVTGRSGTEYLELSNSSGETPTKSQFRNIRTPIKITGWVNVYKDSAFGNVYHTKTAANSAPLNHGNVAVACIQITIEGFEGDGL